MAEKCCSQQMLSEAQVRAQLAAIVDSSDDAILSKTPDGVVTTWNKGAERIYGYSAAEAVGRHISFLVPEERREELDRFTNRILDGQRVDNLETARVTKAGQEVWVSLTLSPILVDGKLVGVSSIARDITERRRMERCLKESEKRYRTLVEFAPDAVVVHQDGRFVYANCAALGIFGASSLHDLKERSLLDLVHGEDRQFVQERLRQLLEGEEIPLREFRLLRLNGESVSVEASSSVVDYQGRLSIQIIARDIGGRKRVEQERERMLKELAFERVRFETVVRQMPVGVIIVEAPTGRLLYDNEESKRILRQEVGEVVGLMDYHRWQLFRPDGSRLPVDEYPIVRAMKGESVVREEIGFQSGDGCRGYLSVNSSPLRDASGEMVAALVVFEDVTRRKEAVKALLDSEQRLNLALDAAEMGSCDMEVKSGRGVWSQRHFLLLGYPAPASSSGAATIDMWQGRIVPEDRDEVLKGLERARKEGSLFRSQHRVARVDDNRLLWVNVMGRFLCEGNGEICRFIGVICDVTEQRKAEEALKASEATLKLAIETTGLGIFEWDLLSGRHQWSLIAKSHYGLPAEVEVTQQLLMSAVHPDDRVHLQQAIDDALASRDGVFSAEYRTVGLSDGKLRWLTSRGKVAFDEHGEARRMVGACLEITEIVEAEKALKEEIAERLRTVEELRKQEQLLIRQGRLAAMGEMIGNIAHQWRQPLNTLGLIVQELPRMYGRDLFNKEYLDSSAARAMQVINYMSKTIDGFRNFFGPDKEKESFRVAEVLNKTVSIVEAAFRELKLTIRVEADQGLEVYGYPNEFSQVILNVLVNAKDALLERRIEQPRVSVRLFREHDRTVMTIADNAGGIAPEIMERIFDPYFTTKGPDKGTGIGLFMSKTIIEKNMNGSLTARNTEEGAEFRIEV
ncbi:MAG TPA: PAS domain S-box protein [Geomonas sp.]|nr:PAS domain S-box protein [Geomonas sp.]